MTNDLKQSLISQPCALVLTERCQLLETDPIDTKFSLVTNKNDPQMSHID